MRLHFEKIREADLFWAQYETLWNWGLNTRLETNGNKIKETLEKGSKRKAERDQWEVAGAERPHAEKNYKWERLMESSEKIR